MMDGERYWEEVGREIETNKLVKVFKRERVRVVAENDALREQLDAETTIRLTFQEENARLKADLEKAQAELGRARVVMNWVATVSADSLIRNEVLGWLKGGV